METAIERIKAREWDLRELGLRLQVLLAFDEALREATREKAFRIQNTTAWYAMLAARDMFVVDFASWSTGVVKVFLPSLQGPDLRALQRGPKPSERSGDDDGYIKRTVFEHRVESYRRLFPEAAAQSRWTPNLKDVLALKDAFHARMQALKDDRDAHRAHRFDLEKTKGDVTALDLKGLTEHFRYAHRFVADLRLLADSSTLDFPRLDSAGGDERSRDMVDLTLCGSLAFTVYSWNQLGGDHQFLWQKRAAFYEGLHARHAKAGSDERLFNELPFAPHDGD